MAGVKLNHHFWAPPLWWWEWGFTLVCAIIVFVAPVWLHHLFGRHHWRGGSGASPLFGTVIGGRSEALPSSETVVVVVGVKLHPLLLVTTAVMVGVKLPVVCHHRCGGRVKLNL